MSQLLSSYIAGVSATAEEDLVRKRAFTYWGNFTNTMLTMFEMTFANWVPSCRFLTENVSTWFGLVYIVYRCVFIFACMNVITAVFIGETNKAAAADDDLAMRKKKKDHAAYT